MKFFYLSSDRQNFISLFWSDYVARVTTQFSYTFLAMFISSYKRFCTNTWCESRVYEYCVVTLWKIFFSETGTMVLVPMSDAAMREPVDKISYLPRVTTQFSYTFLAKFISSYKGFCTNTWCESRVYEYCVVTLVSFFYHRKY